MRMKNVLLVFPGLTLNLDEGAKHRLNCYINEYKNAGYNVDVLVFDKSRKNISELKGFLNENANWIVKPYILPILKNIVLAKLSLSYMKAMVAIQAKKKHYEVIQMELYSLRSRLCPSVNTTFITDFHGDMPYEQIENKGYNKESSVIQSMFQQQKDSIKTSDVCIAVSENLKKQLEINTGEKISKYCIISCAVDLKRFIDAETAQIDLSDRIAIGYCGGLQGWQNVDKIIDVAYRLHQLDKRIYLVLYSNSPLDKYQKQLDLLGKENYMVKGLKSIEVPSFLKLLDAGFLLRSNLVLNKVSSPTKICEYLAAGAPLICTQYSGDYERCVKNGENGFVADAPEFTEAELHALMEWLKKVHADKPYYRNLCIKSVESRTFHSEYLNLLNLIMK